MGYGYGLQYFLEFYCNEKQICRHPVTCWVSLFSLAFGNAFNGSLLQFCLSQSLMSCFFFSTVKIFSLLCRRSPHSFTTAYPGSSQAPAPKWGSWTKKYDPVFCGMFRATAAVCGFHGEGQRNVAQRGCINALPLCLWSKWNRSQQV